MSPRRNKEVSVAGESPGKSEQRKSSGTAEERDPRLAVFRESSAAAGTNTSVSGTATDGGTDSETAVFRVPPSTAADAPEGASGASEGAEGAQRASKPSEGAEEAEGVTGKGVTAPGAGTTAPGAGTTAPGTGTPGPGAAADKAGTTDAEAGTDSAAEAGADTDAEPDERPRGAADSDSGPEPKSDAKSGSKPEPGSESGSGSDAEAPPADARLRAVVAAWVETDPDDEAAGQSGATEGVGKPSDGDGDASGDVGDGPAVADEKAKSTDGRTSDDADGVSADDDPAVDDDDAPPAGGDAKTPAGRGTDETAGAEDDAPAVSASDDDAPRVPKTREEASPAEDAGPASDGRGIDHPTAVFKAPRAERVDQPTTALKLPPKAKAKEETKEEGRKPASWAAGASGATETPAERTSTFVPLRSDDVRPAAVVGPTVTPDVAAGPGTPASPGAGFAEAERTRQQPMPPRPPLDLLAELTNTPPPPETPVRTAVRRVKIWTPLVLLLLVIFAIAQASRSLPEPVLELTAKQTYDFEGSKPSLPWPDEGQGFMAATGLGTVDSFGEQEAVPIGSVAKAMTAYVVLKGHPLKQGEDGPAVKVDAKAEAEGKLDSVGESTLNTIKAGDTLTEREALSAIMIPSANNIARLLARWDAGSEEAFVKKMNDTAKELGMTKTTYTDPSGLNATTVSSAEDQVKLGEKLVEIPALMDITKLPSWTDPSGHDHRNYNTLVPYDGALGIKTGSTTKAGGNLLFAAHKKVGDTDQLIVGAILGQHKPPIIDTVNAVSKEAVVATQDLLETRTVVKKGQVVGVVDDGFGHTTEVVVAEDVKAVGWPGLTVKLELTDDGKVIPNVAAAGTRVGTMTVGEGASQVEVAVTLGDALAEPSFGDKLTRIT
ncbi:D-alanyl-D-alanine carboxypeptidase [Streptomyces sp. NPDC005794]|uniref:D-alanyl-D-alanine carboxypeptidase n=1 Tax=Streptomyces sp. NPDC005794 TaxID=3364733 RepID=UPI00368C348F